MESVMEMRMLKKSVYAGVLLILAVSFGGATSLSDAYQDGVTAARNGQFNVAVAKLRGLAENGDTQAQYALGYSYERGFGVPQDYAQSARWYRLAADKKHYWARINLGLLLARGRGLPQDKSKAKEWINLAAEQSGPKERYEIGLLFSGLDPVFDAALAFRWLHDAALQGFPKAQKTLAKNYSIGRLISKDYKKAEFWMLKAAEQDYAPAQVLLGRWYWSGEVIPINRVQAHRWYSRAASQGFKFARERLTEITKKMTSSEIGEAKRLEATPRN